jgi:outer membrane protein OmpA-like peptidoglycan-associated protein
LNKVKDIVAKLDAQKVTVEGHTDSTGSKQANQVLSEKRAATVAQFITSSNVVNSSQVESHGMSYDRPLATNKTKEGRAQNRRVDIIITPKSVE